MSILKKTIITNSNIDLPSGKVKTHEFYQKQLRFKK